MRTEQQMYDLILNFARERESIRGVLLNGSRANPDAPRDRFQDFDIVYAVEEIQSFLEDRSWLKGFGKPAIIQEPDDSLLFSGGCDPKERYAFLMQFADGNRIDLSLQSLDLTRKTYREDSLTVVLLDKDSMFAPLPEPSDRDYWVKKPDEGRFWGCCNEFWWVSTYVAKGLWRHEILYAMDCLNFHVRPMLLRMLSWQAGMEHEWKITAGKSGKYLDRYLPRQSMEKLLKTYPPAEENEVWKALEEMADLFSQTAQLVAEGLGYRYRAEEETGVREYLGL